MSLAVTSSQPELVWECFGRKRDGFFVEVGLKHPTEGSQTWLLEQNGWRGLGYRLMKRTESHLLFVLQPKEISMTALGEDMRRWRKVFLDLPFRELRRWRQARRRCARR